MLQQDIQDVTAGYILDFLSTVIHHRNQLKNYISAIHMFNSLFDVGSPDIYFSEKMKLTLKKEPQSVCAWVRCLDYSSWWYLEEDGNKEYHCYLFYPVIGYILPVGMMLVLLLVSV